MLLHFFSNNSSLFFSSPSHVHLNYYPFPLPFTLPAKHLSAVFCLPFLPFLSVYLSKPLFFPPLYKSFSYPYLEHTNGHFKACEKLSAVIEKCSLSNRKKAAGLVEYIDSVF